MKRMFFAIAFCTVLFGGSSVRAEEPAFRFDGKDYFLRSDKGGIREYLTGGETFDKWTTLISIRQFDGLRDGRAYAQKLVRTAEASGPAARGQVLAKGEMWVADFIVFPPEDAKTDFAEWNLWRIRQKPRGIEAVQYARRFYGFSEASAEEIKASRARILGELENLTP